MRRIEDCDTTVSLLEQELWKHAGIHLRKKRSAIRFPFRLEDGIWFRILNRSITVEHAADE